MIVVIKLTNEYYNTDNIEYNLYYRSFGWEGSEVFQQQDVQELTRVLFDALEESFKGTEVENIIDQLYAGELIDYLRCIDVDYQSERVDKFLDFALAILPFGRTEALHSLSGCIESYLQPEILDGDNKYYAESVGRKVTAIKGLKFGKLPQIMSVQLKRFVYDFSNGHMVQKKVNDSVSFPMLLDMNKYVARKTKSGVSTDSTGERTGVVDNSEDGEFELFLKEQMAILRQQQSASEGSGSAGGVDGIGGDVVKDGINGVKDDNETPSTSATSSSASTSRSSPSSPPSDTPNCTSPIIYASSVPIVETGIQVSVSGISPGSPLDGLIAAVDVILIDDNGDNDRVGSVDLERLEGSYDPRHIATDDFNHLDFGSDTASASATIAFSSADGGGIYSGNGGSIGSGSMCSSSGAGPASSLLAGGGGAGCVGGVGGVFNSGSLNPFDTNTINATNTTNIGTPILVAEVIDENEIDDYYNGVEIGVGVNIDSIDVETNPYNTQNTRNNGGTSSEIFIEKCIGKSGKNSGKSVRIGLPEIDKRDDESSNHNDAHMPSQETIDKLIETRGEWVYELFAVLNHSGAIAGGHYYAYIKNLETQKWFNFNDSNVSEITEEKVSEAWGGKAKYDGWFIFVLFCHLFL